CFPCPRGESRSPEEVEGVGPARRSRHGWWTVLATVAAFVLVVVAVVGPPPASARLVGAAEPEPKVAAAVHSELRGGGTADFWVRFGDRPDLTPYREITDWGERGQ